MTFHDCYSISTATVKAVLECLLIIDRQLRRYKRLTFICIHTISDIKLIGITFHELSGKVRPHHKTGQLMTDINCVGYSVFEFKLKLRYYAESYHILKFKKLYLKIRYVSGIEPAVLQLSECLQDKTNSTQNRLSFIVECVTKDHSFVLKNLHCV